MVLRRVETPGNSTERYLLTWDARAAVCMHLSGCSLYLWDRLSKTIPLNRLMVISLFSEWILVALFFLEMNSFFILLAGGINGLFNCSFWMIQRLLFLDTVTPHNSGKKFGDFQIVAFLVLKAGIFALDNSISLSVVYLAAAPLSMVYLCYHGIFHEAPSKSLTKTLR